MTELEIQNKEIKKVLFIVGLPILVFAILYVYYQNNNLELVKKEYEKIRSEEYYGRVIKKLEDGDYPRANRYVILKNNRKVNVSNELYNKIAINDSVSKSKDCDSIYFYLIKGEIVIQDDNAFERDNYLNLLNKKREK
ncbi:hypothetical protein [uncultured Formosa sp.]|uniref:hypothetical protein n=1 Tax=uncultured Formosa sp. TaxID=255435 RepID=UPI00260E78C3|nr:hypothetical protein [uncultured Formosa sp.]